MWFIYAGFISFCFFFIIRQYINKTIISILIGLLLLIGCSVNYVSGEIIIDCSICVAVPFMYIGYMIRRYRNLILNVTNLKVLANIVLFLTSLYFEAFINHGLHKNVEVYFSTIPLTTLIFIYLVRNPELISFRLKIPIKVSMDIYIWHRLVYVILFGVIGLNIFSSFEAIVTFIVVIFIAIIVRIKLTPVKR